MKFKLLTLFILLGCILFSSCYAKKLRKRSVVKVDLHIDSLQLIEQNGTFRVDLKAYMNNGKTKATYGIKNGTWSWDRFIVKIENGAFLDGTVLYNARELYEEEKTINLIIRPRNYAYCIDTFRIKPPKPVEIQVFPYPYGEFATDIPIKMELAVTFDNGTKLTTPQNKNSFLWNLYKLKHEGETVNGNTITVKGDLANIPTYTTVEAYYQYEEGISCSTKIALDYKTKPVLDFSGVNGWGGQSSSRNWSTATNGNKGSRGQRGGGGSSGTNGENIVVYCDMVKLNNMKLLVVKVKGNSKEETAIINTEGGKLYINNRGGNGGQGGNGGRGGEGAHENANNQAAEGGDGGSGGQGGNGGNGGNINLYISDEAMPFMNLLQMDNAGGLAGGGGSGGRSGRGGLSDDANLLDIIFGGSLGNTGARGTSGMNGHNGAPIVLNILPQNVIRSNLGIK